MNKEYLAVKQVSTAGFGRDSDKGWWSCWVGVGYGELQRQRSHKGEVAWESSCRIKSLFCIFCGSTKSAIACLSLLEVD